MIEIEIDEKTGTMIVNGPALQLLTDEEYDYLNALGRKLKTRLKRQRKKESEENR